MLSRKLPGFGSLGVELSDLDLRTIDTNGMLEIGSANLDQLLVVIKKECVGGISLERFHEICMSWVGEGDHDFDYSRYTFTKMTAKYGAAHGEGGLPMEQLSDEDRFLLEEGGRIRKGIERFQGMARVTGIRDDAGHTTGMFADGELEWHSNNQGADRRAPVVGLLASQGSAGSRTEFLSTVDAYQALTPGWQSMCDELIAVHRWKPGAMAPGLSEVQERLLRFNMCPDDDSELPLVMHSPGGHKGLHFAFTTIDHFKGVSQVESDKIVAFLKSHVIRDEYVYGHDWQDGDLLFFDNTITLHRRPTKDCSKRLMFRMAFNYNHLLALRGAARPTMIASGA